MAAVKLEWKQWSELHGERIQQVGEIEHVHAYLYDVPSIVTITVDALKKGVVKTYDRDRAELHGA